MARKRTTKRRPVRRKKKRLSAAQKRALAKARRAAAAKRRKRKAPVRRKRRTAKRTSTRRKPVARRKATRRRRKRGRRRSSGKVTYTPVRGRIYRKNPRFNVRNIMSRFQQGVMDGAAVVAGKAGTRLLANFVPVPDNIKQGAIGNFALQGLSAVVVSMLAQNVVSAQTARFIAAGGFAAPMETLMKGLPVIGDALGDDWLEMGEYLMGEAPGLPVGEYGMLPPGQEPYMGDAPGLPIGEYVEY